MRISSQQPRRQRKAAYSADHFERRRRMAVPLSRELRQRYGRRSVPVRKGDTVRVLSGSYVGREERVAKVDRRSYGVTLDNITGKTADQKLKPLPIRTSHLLLIRLNLSDAWRRRTLKVPEGEVAEDIEAEVPPMAEPLRSDEPPEAGSPEASSPPSPSDAEPEERHAPKPKRRSRSALKESG